MKFSNLVTKIAVSSGFILLGCSPLVAKADPLNLTVINSSTKERCAITLDNNITLGELFNYLSDLFQTNVTEIKFNKVIHNESVKELSEIFGKDTKNANLFILPQVINPTLAPTQVVAPVRPKAVAPANSETLIDEIIKFFPLCSRKDALRCLEAGGYNLDAAAGFILAGVIPK